MGLRTTLNEQHNAVPTMVAYDIFQQCLLYNHLRIYVVAVCDCMPVLACSEPKRHFMSAHTHISSHHPPFYPFTPTPALTPTAAHSHPPTYRCTPTPHPQFHTLTPPPAVLDPPTDTPPKGLLGQGFSTYTSSEITPPSPPHFNTPAAPKPPTDTPPKEKGRVSVRTPHQRLLPKGRMAG